jgi:hypothetical protein
MIEKEDCEKKMVFDLQNKQKQTVKRGALQTPGPQLILGPDILYFLLLSGVLTSHSISQCISLSA